VGGHSPPRRSGPLGASLVALHRADDGRRVHGTLCLFAWEAEKARPTRLLIDATQFRHPFGSGVLEWRDAHIIPRYGAAGVRKFAFHVPAGFPKAGAEETEGPAIFPTRWFVDREAALDWLRTD
jgi:hypothetical protein